MDATVDAAALLGGPRGRRLCAELAAADPVVRRAWFDVSSSDGEPAAGRRFVAALGQASAKVRVGLDEELLISCLADAVTFAHYWQPPDAAEVRLADADVTAALRPFAEAVVGSAAWRWWNSTIGRAGQAHVQWIREHSSAPPQLAGAAECLQQWRARTVEAEHRAAVELPDDPTAPYSGQWWSTPAWEAVTTSRARPGLGATQLALVEDSGGWTEAVVSPLRPAPGARVYEIDGPPAWVRLVNRYPLEVSRSRRHDWYRTTGRVGRWFIPDWPGVAGDYDGVHLTVAAYLATAGRALPLDEADGSAGGATVLAGWDPDATIWLTDVLAASGPSARWQQRSPDFPSWALCSGRQ